MEGVVPLKVGQHSFAEKSIGMAHLGPPEISACVHSSGGCHMSFTIPKLEAVLFCEFEL